MFSITNQSSQLLLHLIERQCKPKKESELTFFHKGKVLKFDLREFALITFLNYGPIPNQEKTKIKGEQYIRNIYFEGEKNC